MSERAKYSMVERYRLDTWAFIVFFAIAGLISHW